MTLTEQEMQMIEDGIARDKALIAKYEAALRSISLGSQNSMTTKEDLGREARRALRDQ